jgi:hypothetical protein
MAENHPNELRQFYNLFVYSKLLRNSLFFFNFHFVFICASFCLFVSIYTLFGHKLVTKVETKKWYDL